MNAVSTPTIRILVACHKDAPSLESDIFVPIHVGRAIADEHARSALSHLQGDDKGDNISAKNLSYAELTAAYWAWRNLSTLGNPDFVGLMHYRRYLDLRAVHQEVTVVPSAPAAIRPDLDRLNPEELRALCLQYPIVVPKKQRILRSWIPELDARYRFLDESKRRRLKASGCYLSLFEHYSLMHLEEDFRLAIRVLLERHPDYLKTLDASLSDIHGRFCNIFIMRTDEFRSYMEFLFAILFEVETRLSERHPIHLMPRSFHGRALAFLGERLLSIYIDHKLQSGRSKFVGERAILFFRPDDQGTQRMSDAEPLEDSASPQPVHIPIILAADNKFAREVAVVITSILVNSGPGETFTFYVLCGGISEPNRYRIEQLKKTTNFDIYFISVDDQKFEECEVFPGMHFSKANYFRMAMASAFPDLAKAIYLDCDLIVVESLRELWETELDCHAIAAVEDPWKFVVEEWKLEMGFSRSASYFNSGVMLVDLSAWRRDGLEDKFFDAARSLYDLGYYRFADQDVMNFVLQGRFKKLDAKWNVQQTFYWSTSDRTSFSDWEMRQARERPRIIHFSGDLKPWHRGCFHPERNCYAQYVNMTPWKGFARPTGLMDSAVRQFRLSKAGVVSYLTREFWMQTPQLRRMQPYIYDSKIEEALRRLSGIRTLQVAVGLAGTVTKDLLQLLYLGGYISVQGGRKLIELSRQIRR